MPKELSEGAQDAQNSLITSLTRAISEDQPFNKALNNAIGAFSLLGDEISQQDIADALESIRDGHPKIQDAINRLETDQDFKEKRHTEFQEAINQALPPEKRTAPQRERVSIMLEGADPSTDNSNNGPKILPDNKVAKPVYNTTETNVETFKTMLSDAIKQASENKKPIKDALSTQIKIMRTATVGTEGIDESKFNSMVGEALKDIRQDIKSQEGKKQTSKNNPTLKAIKELSKEYEAEIFSKHVEIAANNLIFPMVSNPKYERQDNFTLLTSLQMDEGLEEKDVQKKLAKSIKDTKKSMKQAKREEMLEIPKGVKPNKYINHVIDKALEGISKENPQYKNSIDKARKSLKTKSGLRNKLSKVGKIFNKIPGIKKSSKAEAGQVR